MSVPTGDVVAFREPNTTWETRPPLYPLSTGILTEFGSVISYLCTEEMGVKVLFGLRLS